MSHKPDKGIKDHKPDKGMRDHKPDDRSDNVEKIQFNIDKTILNYELAEEMIAKTDDEKMRQVLKDKNERRLESLNAMREEIRDEALDRKKRSDSD